MLKTGLPAFRVAVALAAAMPAGLIASPPLAQEAPAVPGADGTASSASSTNGPVAKVLDRAEIQGVLGRQVRGRAGEDMGRIVEVIVDRTGGQPRAAIIDFGGFLGVGVRKIAVDWGLLQFATDKGSDLVTLELTRDQVKAAPEYKEGRPIVVLTRTGPVEPAPD